MERCRYYWVLLKAGICHQQFLRCFLSRLKFPEQVKGFRLCNQGHPRPPPPHHISENCCSIHRTLHFPASQKTASLLDRFYCGYLSTCDKLGAKYLNHTDTRYLNLINFTRSVDQSIGLNAPSWQQFFAKSAKCYLSRLDIVHSGWGQLGSGTVLYVVSSSSVVYGWMSGGSPKYLQTHSSTGSIYTQPNPPSLDRQTCGLFFSGSSAVHLGRNISRGFLKQGSHTLQWQD